MERSGTLSEPFDNSTTPYIKKRPTLLGQPLVVSTPFGNTFPMASTFIIGACKASRSSSYIFIFDSQVSFCIYGISYFAMVTGLLCSTSTGLLAFVFFALISPVLSVR